MSQFDYNNYLKNNPLFKESSINENSGGWNVKNIQALINDYATEKRLDFKPTDTQKHVSKYGSVKKAYFYKLGGKDLAIIDDKAAGAPRLNNVNVIIGTIDPNTSNFKDALSVSKFGSWGVEEVTKMLDTFFEKNK
jgi:hypothetical protein